MELSIKRLLTLCTVIICSLISCEIGVINAQRTFLDKFINEYRSFRGGLFKFVGRTDTNAAYLWSLKRQVCRNPKTNNILRRIKKKYISFKFPSFEYDYLANESEMQIRKCSVCVICCVLPPN